MKAPTPLLALLASLASAPAQEPDRYLPRDPLFRMCCDTPASLRAQFADTDLGALLDSREVEGWIEGTPLGVLLGRGESAVEVPPRIRRMEELLEGFEGRCSMTLDFVGRDAQGEPAFFMAMALGGDDTRTLEELEVLLVESAEQDRTPLFDVDIAGETFLSGERDDDGFRWLVPRLLGDDLVCFAASQGLEERVARILDRRDEPLPEELSDGGAMGMSIDVRRLLQAAIPFMDREELDVEPERIIELFRFDSIEEVSLTMRADAPHVVFDLVVRVDPDRPTLLEFLRPPDDGSPELLDLVPRDHGEWTVGHLRPMAVYDWIGDLAYEIEGPGGMDRLEEGFEETFGVRLVEDLLAHWGSEVVVLGSIAPPGPGARPDEMFADLALAFELADAGAVETSLERMLRSRGLHVIGESRDFRGIEVHTLPFFGVFEVHYTFGNDALAVGFGRDPDVFPRLLDRLAARDRGEEPGPFPDPVADRLERMPEDWRNMRVLDVRRLADNVFRGMEARVRGRSPGGPGPAAGTIGSSRDTVRSLLERYDLDVLVWTTTFTDDALKVHAVW